MAAAHSDPTGARPDTILKIKAYNAFATWNHPDAMFQGTPYEAPDMRASAECATCHKPFDWPCGSCLKKLENPTAGSGGEDGGQVVVDEVRCNVIKCNACKNVFHSHCTEEWARTHNGECTNISSNGAHKLDPSEPSAIVKKP